MADFKDPFVVFKHDRQAKNVTITWGIVTLTKTLDDGKLSCYLPGYDIYFSANKREDVRKKAIGLTHIYFDNFAKHKKRGIQALALELHKIGFKAPNDFLTLSNILKNVPTNTKFKHNSLERPEIYEDADVEATQSTLEMAM